MQDPSLSKIPRLNGASGTGSSYGGGGMSGTRTSSIPNPLRCQKSMKIGKPITSIRSQVTSALPKNLATEKLCQASNLVQEKVKKSFLSRFSSKSTGSILKGTKSSASYGGAMVIDEATQEQDAEQHIPSDSATSNKIALLKRSDTYTFEDEKNSTKTITSNEEQHHQQHQQHQKQQQQQTNFPIDNTFIAPNTPPVANSTINVFPKLSYKDCSNLFETSECFVDSPVYDDETYKVEKRSSTPVESQITKRYTLIGPSQDFSPITNDEGETLDTTNSILNTAAANIISSTFCDTDEKTVANNLLSDGELMNITEIKNNGTVVLGARSNATYLMLDNRTEDDCDIECLNNVTMMAADNQAERLEDEQMEIDDIPEDIGKCNCFFFEICVSYLSVKIIKSQAFFNFG